MAWNVDQYAWNILPIIPRNHPVFLFLLFFWLQVCLVASMEDIEKGNELTGNISSPFTIPSLPFTRYLYRRKTFSKAHEKKKSKRFKNTRPSQPSTNSPDTGNSRHGRKAWVLRATSMYILPYLLQHHHPIPTTTSNEQTPLQISCPSPPPPSVLLFLRFGRVGRSVRRVTLYSTNICMF